MDDIADGLVSLSLVGSLFFSVSLEASRTRILLYLLLTAVPLAIVAPAIGPVLDRSRAGYRRIVVGSQLARVGLALALAGSLLTLAFYPIVFGILLSRKAYALAKTAVLSQLVPDSATLVSASGHLARTGTIAGGVGALLGGLLYATVGVEWLPVVAAGVFLVSAAISRTLPELRPQETTPAAVVVRAEIPADVRLATSAVVLIRAAAGALTFLLAFAIKRGGSDEWIFAIALVAAGVGAFSGTIVAPLLHRRMPSNRIIVIALLVPGTVSAFGVLTVGNLAIIAIAFTIGLGGSLSSRAMDEHYGRVPRFVRGRAISLSELSFQLANVAGAAAAVLASPGPRAGFAVVAVLLVLGGIAYASRARLSLRREAGSLLLGRRRSDEMVDLPGALLDEAVHHAELGSHRVAIAIADAAVRAAQPCPVADRETVQQWVSFAPLIEAATRRDGEVTPDLSVAVIATARKLLAGRGLDGVAEDTPLIAGGEH